MEYFTSLFSNFFNEEQYEIQVRHGGNQCIDEFNDNFITLKLEKSKTIEDVKLALIPRIKYLSNTNINLRLSIFGDPIINSCQLDDLQHNGVIKLFIQIPNW